MDATERETQLAAVTQTLQNAIKAAEKGEWDGAKAYIDAAETAFQALPDEPDPRRIGLAAAIAEGRGQLALRAQQTEEAIPFLENAIRLRREEAVTGGNPPPLSIAVGFVNLTGAFHRLGQLDKALACNLHARAELGPIDLPPARLFLAAALEAGGNLLSQLDRHVESLATFRDGLILAERLLQAKLPGAEHLRTEILIAAARAAFRFERPQDAINFCQRAADLAWERFEQDQNANRDSIQHFIAAQMNILAFAEKAGKFSVGEDSLFKVLRLVGPDPRVIERGIAFYEELKKLDDAALEAGNLPREEVEESLQQLLDMAAKAQPPRANA